jgi:hypothetical protein
MQLLTADLPKNLVPVETRLSNLERIFKPGTDSITLQVGNSKIVISQSGIELECQGTIQIKSNQVNINSSDVSLSSCMNMHIRAGNLLLLRACGVTSIASNDGLVLRAPTINNVTD